MDIPKEIEKWLIYDTEKLEYIFKEGTPTHIKEEYHKFLEEIQDFIIDTN